MESPLALPLTRSRATLRQGELARRLSPDSVPTLLQDQWSKRVGAARVRMEGRTAVEAGERVSDVRQAARTCDASGSPAAALRVSSEARATEEAQRYRAWQLRACQQDRGGLGASGPPAEHGAATSSFHSANKCEQLHEYLITLV